MWVAELVEVAWVSEGYGPLRTMTEIARNDDLWQLMIAAYNYINERPDWAETEDILISKRE